LADLCGYPATVSKKKVFVENLTFRISEVAGIATRYGLDDPGNESWWERYFPQPSGPILGPTQLPIQWAPESFPVVKLPGRGVEHRPNAEVKKE